MKNANAPAVADPAAPPGAVRRRVTRWHGATSESLSDALAEEVPIAIRCNGAPFAVMMASPLDLEDFARGFALTERLVDTLDELVDIKLLPQIDGIEVALTLTAACATRLSQRPRAFEGRTGCGICGAREIDELLHLPTRLSTETSLAAASLRLALTQLPTRQRLNQVTGATHAAVWCNSDGTILYLREDVGRHNALDKLIGAMLRAGGDPTQGFALLTSRASYEMVMKSARAGISIVVAVSAPTVLAVSLADSAGITLIGFARGADCTVYTHPQRYFSA